MPKPKPKLTHMPAHLKQLIVDKAIDQETKESVGGMSKEFLACFDKSPMERGKLILQVQNAKVSVHTREWRNRVIEFYPNEKGALMKNPNGNWERVLEEQDYRKAAVQYILDIFKNPSTKVRHLGFVPYFGEGDVGNLDSLPNLSEDRRVIFDEMQKLLLRLCFQNQNPLNVGEVHFGFEVEENHIFQIFPYLQPGTLHTINLLQSYSTCSVPVLDLATICEMEQWKQAKVLLTGAYKTSLPLEKWTHAECVELRWMDPMATLKEICETFINQPKLRKLKIEFDSSPDDTGIEEYMAQFDDSWSASDQYTEIRLDTDPVTLIDIHREEFEILLMRSEEIYTLIDE